VRLDPSAALRFAAVAIWAAFFDYLWLSGDSLRFVGPRTQWVVPFGGIALTLVALLYLRALRTSLPPKRPRLGEIAGLLALVAPVIAVFIVPAPTLGALAVERKSSAQAGGAARAAAPPREDEGGGDDLLKIAYASQNPAEAGSVGVRTGQRVSLHGVVSDSRPDHSRFTVSRFMTSCCAADAIPYNVRTRLAKPGSGTPPVDTWVRAWGTLERERDGGFLVAVERFERIPEPVDPYN